MTRSDRLRTLSTMDVASLMCKHSKCLYPLSLITDIIFERSANILWSRICGMSSLKNIFILFICFSSKLHYMYICNHLFLFIINSFLSVGGLERIWNCLSFLKPSIVSWGTELFLTYCKITARFFVLISLYDKNII